jgi:hypothetical protein
MKLIVSVVDKDSVCQQDGMIFFPQGIPISLKEKAIYTGDCPLFVF